jgi:peptidoglycan/LPS O-acetylase OafA/YrhL
VAHLRCRSHARAHGSDSCLGRSQPHAHVVSRDRPGFRPDVEGLRAVAVVAVLLYHAGVPHLVGGFVGVDVFFVISGFLITRGLLDELLSTGRLSLSRFYAARARRILPAAAVVLVAVAMAAYWLLSPLRAVGVETDVRDAALYLVNWHFISQQTSYMHAGSSPSPVLNFWSLSVEEQFYLVWPVLLLAAVRLAGRLRVSKVFAVGVALTIVLAGSLTLSIRWTRTDEPLAYLSSPSRAWEFALGAAVALLVPRLDRLAADGRAQQIRGVGRMAGLGAVLVSCVWFSAGTTFPGISALLPASGAALLIAAGVGSAYDGDSNAGRLVGAVLGSRPFRTVGRYSYSLYLWHWPVLVLVEARTGVVSWPWQLLIVGWAAIPAVVTTRLVEQPLRFSTVVRSSASCGLSIGASAMCASLLGSLLVGSAVLRQVDIAGPAATRLRASLTSASMAAQPFGRAASSAGGQMQPSLGGAAVENTKLPARCRTTGSRVPPPCFIGPASGRGHVLLYGDGTVEQWLPSVETVAKDHGWSVEVVANPSCPLGASAAPESLQDVRRCTKWQFTMRGLLDRGTHPSLIFVAAVPPAAAAGADLTRTVQALDPLGAPIVYLRRTPMERPGVLGCLASSPGRSSACSEQRDRSLSADPVTRAITTGRVPGVHLVDLSAALCPAGPTCPAVIGSTLLYRSDDALTTRAATLLGPTLEADLEVDRLVSLHLGPTGAPRSSGSTVPSPVQAPNDWPADTSRCLIGAAATLSKPCYYGDVASKTDVVLFGDSHALQWIPALAVMADQHGWRLEVYTKEGCPAPLLYPWAPNTQRPYPSCTTWRTNTLETIERGPKPAMIVLGTLNRYATSSSALISGWRSTLAKLERVGAPMIYLRDTPLPTINPPSCLSGALEDWSKCAFPERSAVPADPVAVKLEAGWFPRVRVINVDDLLCRAGSCPAAIDGIDLYIDQSHLTAVASTALAPVMSDEIDSALANLTAIHHG